MVKKNRANRKTSSSSSSAFESDRFRTEKHQENYEKLYIFRSVWAKRKVILDELDPKICRNFKSRGWLSLLDISYPPLAVLIREFYLNLSIHSTSSNIQFVKSWIKGRRVYHYFSGSGLCSWCTFGTIAHLSL